MSDETAANRLRKLATGRDRHGGLILPYSDDVLAVLDALGAAQREIAEHARELKAARDSSTAMYEKYLAAQQQVVEWTAKTGIAEHALEMAQREIAELRQGRTRDNAERKLEATEARCAELRERICQGHTIEGECGAAYRNRRIAAAQAERIEKLDVKLWQVQVLLGEWLLASSHYGKQSLVERTRAALAGLPGKVEGQ